MTGELQLPAGFRFHPTDEELVVHYLCRRCAEQPIAVPIIAEIDLYKFDPWQLPEMALYGEKEWYFFSPRDRKYPNGSRPNRSTATGYWKATGADKPIGKPDALGIKKALVFYAGKAPKGVKTNWIMHEYRLANVDRSAGKRKTTRLDDWVLCRLYNKKGSIERNYTYDRKPNVLAPSPPLNPEISASSEVMFHMESSDSMPRVQTDSSGSDEQAVSPELTSHREVQSASGWGDFGDGFYFPMETVQNDYSTPPPQFQWQWDHMSPLQDMFMNLQN